MFEVKKEKCDQCLYGKNKLVSDERRKQILSDCSKNDSHFICHKATIDKKDVCCRGFYDASSTNLIRISGRLNMIEFVD